MIKTSFQSVLQTLPFSNNDNGNKTDKSYKIHPVIEHRNKIFAKTLSISPFKSDDKHMCKFKGEGEKQKEKEKSKSRKRRKRRKV